MRKFSFNIAMETDPPPPAGHDGESFYDTVSERGLDLQSARGAQRQLDIARKAENLGYDRFLVGDHLYSNPDALILCMAVAGVTSTLRLTQAVLINDFRHPVQVAKAIASIDVFSNGRAEVGLGAGYNENEYRQAGVPFDPPSVRIARLRESATIIKELLTSSDPVTYRGKHYTIDGLRGLPRPVQTPHPPMVIGGGGKMMLELAGELADSVDIGPGSFHPEGIPRDPRSWTVEEFEKRIGWVKDGAGDRFADITTGCVLMKVVVTDDREEAAAGLQAQFDAIYRMYGVADGFPVSVDGILDSPFICIGTHDEIAQHLKTLRERFGCTNFTVLPSNLEDMAPVLDALRRE